MTGLTRRRVLTGASAATVAAVVPGIAQGIEPSPLDHAKTREAMEVFGQLNPERQGILLDVMRRLLEVQRHHESRGMTEADAMAALRRQFESRS